MRLLWTQLRKEWLELWATRKTIIVLAVMLALGFLAPISAKVMPELVASLAQGQNVTIILPEPTEKDALAQFVKNTTQMVMIVVLIVSFIAIVTERERGLMTIIFPHALPRSTFVLAKFTALALLVLVGMALSAVATYLYTALLFSPPDPAAFIGMVLLLYVFLLVMMALALLASTLGRTTIMAASITFGFVILVTLPGMFVNFTPAKLSEWAAALVADVTVQPRWDALAVSLLLTVIAVGASCVILNRQEIVSASGA
jgi:ABC-2 type transport system permease protein